jgi:hypothetical protein
MEQFFNNNNQFLMMQNVFNSYGQGYFAINQQQPYPNYCATGHYNHPQQINGFFNTIPNYNLNNLPIYQPLPINPMSLINSFSLPPNFKISDPFITP